MSVPLDAAVRAASGVLLVGLGAFAFLAGRSSRRARAIGAGLMSLGPIFVLLNLGPALPWDLAASVRAAAFFNLLVAAAAAALVHAECEGDRRLLRRTALGAIAVFALFAAAMLALDGADATGTVSAATVPAGAMRALVWGGAVSYASQIAVFIVLVARFARAAPHGSSDALRRAWLTAGWGVFFSAAAAAEMFQPAPGLRVRAVVLSVAVAALAVAWALSARGPLARVARNVSLVLTVPYVVCAALGAAGINFGQTGVARILGVAILSYAIFRHDLLDRRFRVATVRRGTSATFALALLLVVAQVAQEFVSAQYGLLLGGALAAGMVFAAQPIQRAAERLGERAVPVAHSAPAGDIASSRADKEESYKRALRLALRDRVLTREEEVHLHEVAEHMGIGAGRAMALRVEVEREGRP